MMTGLRDWGCRLLLAGMLMLPAASRAEQIIVFAAASTKDALEDLAGAWAAEGNEPVALSLAGSSELARQIGQGAPASIFLSANPEWMDWLAERDLIATHTRADLLGNDLVLIAHDASPEKIVIGPDLDLSALLDGGKLAMALVDAVPAGIYGKASLENLGLWEGIAPQVVQADNVRAALRFVSTGEAPYGIVYATDAVADPTVHVVGVFPKDSHPPIIYPVAAISGHDSPDARRFLDFLQGPTGKAAFEGQGFVVLTD